MCIKAALTGITQVIPTTLTHALANWVEINSKALMPTSSLTTRPTESGKGNNSCISISNNKKENHSIHLQDSSFEE
jgi:hypothetical protein